MVQQFTEAFVQALQMPDGPSSDSGLKMEVLKVRRAANLRLLVLSLIFCFIEISILCSLSQAVTALVKNFPKPMVSSMQQILPIVWNTLTESAALYPTTAVKRLVEEMDYRYAIS